ncbi:hypothetical protein D3C76_793310 [compost metagenome]
MRDGALAQERPTAPAGFELWDQTDQSKLGPIAPPPPTPMNELFPDVECVISLSLRARSPQRHAPPTITIYPAISLNEIEINRKNARMHKADAPACNLYAPQA